MTFSVLKTAAAWLSLSASSWSPFIMIGRCEAFVVGPPQAKTTTAGRPSRTRVFLEDWVAEMIDAEIYRQGHKKEYEEAWMEKNRAAILHSLRGKGDGGGEEGPSSPSASADGSLAALGGGDAEAFRQHARDVRMAREDPQRYCADRCISTGNRRTKDVFSAPAVGLVSPSF
jgi:hypothetical protein